MNASKAARLRDAAERVRVAGLAERRARRALKVLEVKVQEALVASHDATRERMLAADELVRLAGA